MFSTNLIKTPYKCKSAAMSIYAFLNAHREDELDLNAPYQREYVWTDKEQQALLHSVLSGLPIQAVTITTSNSSEKSMTIVDGKQRLTTLILFFEGKIGYKYNSKTIYVKHMDQAEIRSLKLTSMAVVEMYNHDGSDVSVADQIDLFLRVNFYGVPQSNDHLAKVLAMKEAIIR